VGDLSYGDRSRRRNGWPLARGRLAIQIRVGPSQEKCHRSSLF
jgi:hypothetical protein